MSDSVGLYLNEIGMVPLLNAQEEVELSQAIEAGTDARARKQLGETGRDLDRAIAKLAERQQLAVQLHYFVGLSVEETAAVMHCSVGTVKSTLFDARTRLRTALRPTAHPTLGDSA